MKILKTKLQHGDSSKLAKQLECSEQTITNILNGRTRLISEDYAKSFASFVNSDLEEIASKTGDKYYLKDV